MFNFLKKHEGVIEGSIIVWFCMWYGVTSFWAILGICFGVQFVKSVLNAGRAIYRLVND